MLNRRRAHSNPLGFPYCPLSGKRNSLRSEFGVNEERPKRRRAASLVLDRPGDLDAQGVHVIRDEVGEVGVLGVPPDALGGVEFRRVGRKALESEAAPRSFRQVPRGPSCCRHRRIASSSCSQARLPGHLAALGRRGEQVARRMAHDGLLRPAAVTNQPHAGPIALCHSKGPGVERRTLAERSLTCRYFLFHPL